MQAAMLRVRVARGRAEEQKSGPLAYIKAWGGRRSVLGGGALSRVRTALLSHSLLSGYVDGLEAKGLVMPFI